jgi:large subunit ribosomal protein L4
MLNVPVYNQEGKIVGKEKLDSQIFGLPPKPELIHQVVVSLLANQRHPFAHTKTKGEIRGGGRKPWRQKGTGRARAGSIRSPLWRGGGIVFGPNKEKNYNKKINKKIKKQVFYMCLSDKVKDKKFIVLDTFELKEIKTKTFFTILSKLIPDRKKNEKIKILLSLSENNLNTIKSARNIKNLKTMPVTKLNILDCLRSNYLITTLKGLKIIQEHFKK